MAGLTRWVLASLALLAPVFHFVGERVWDRRYTRYRWDR